MTTSELRFRAMGSDCHVIAVAECTGDPSAVADELTRLAAMRVEILEQSWSRFRASSDLSQLNRAAGRGPICVSADLFDLVTRMRQAWEESSGSFDPTVLTALAALGYDADFSSIVGSADEVDVVLAPAPGMSGVLLDPSEVTVELPRGVGIDAGAIGKGLAADIAVAELLAAGASGVLVNLGGDLAFGGQPPDGRAWVIGVEDERVGTEDPARTLEVLQFREGPTTAGVATSTTLKRRWAQGRRHHVIDPRTGAPSSSDVVQVTVVAEEAWQAEVIATTALLLPAQAAETWLHSRGATAIVLTADSMRTTVDEGVPCG